MSPWEGGGTRALLGFESLMPTLLYYNTLSGENVCSASISAMCSFFSFLLSSSLPPPFYSKPNLSKSAIQRQLLLQRGSVKCLTSCHLQNWWSHPFCFRVSCLGAEKLDWWALPERNIFWGVSEADDTVLYSLVKFSKSNSIMLSKFHEGKTWKHI